MSSDIFNKQEWIQNLKEQKLDEAYIQAFHYVGDIIEDLIEMLFDYAEKIEKLERLIKEHKHLNHNVVMALR